MSLWILDKADVSELVSKMMADYRVVGPKAKGPQFAFGEIDQPDELRLDYATSILPPKKYLQPPEERLLAFKRVNDQTTLETTFEAQPTVIFGVHTCDLHAIRVLDEAFTQNYPDAHYIKRRKVTLLIGLECLQPCDEHSFCKSMGTLTISNGYDLHLTNLGPTYAVDVGSDEGQALLEKYGTARPATQFDMQQLNRVLGAKWSRFSYKLEFDAGELPSLMNQSYNNPVWSALAERCLACGTCTMVCPTCFCFNVYDNVELNLQEGERKRRWDSCMLDEFARVAGGESFRKARAARLRHRFMRKGRYLINKYNALGCVGCGRCARLCLAKISPVEVFNQLHRAKEAQP